MTACGLVPPADALEESENEAVAPPRPLGHQRGAAARAPAGCCPWLPPEPVELRQRRKRLVDLEQMKVIKPV